MHVSYVTEGIPVSRTVPDLCAVEQSQSVLMKTRCFRQRGALAPNCVPAFDACWKGPVLGQESTWTAVLSHWEARLPPVRSVQSVWHFGDSRGH
jgi:hypothetical protein